MRWESLEPLGFPEYLINEYGHVRTNTKGELITRSVNQHGFPYVQIRDEMNVRRVRGIASLVAEMFLEEPKRLLDNTLIRKDGDKMNTHHTNLAWRSRSYAILYHKDLEVEPLGVFQFPVYSLEAGTGRHVRFNTMREASIYYGVREEELFNNMAAGMAIYYAPHVTIYRN